MSVEVVQDIFREVFEDPELLISPDMTAKDVENWDSFNHINLIVALEEVLDISFTTEEMASMANVGDLITILQQKGQDVSW